MVVRDCRGPPTENWRFEAPPIPLGKVRLIKKTAFFDNALIPNR
jgi:hypothetical protein